MNRWPKDNQAALLGCIIVAGFWIYSTTRAKAHSWYPSDCCSSTDCAALARDRVYAVTGGYLIDGRHFVIEAQARASPDNHYHGCFPTPALLRCFFAPKPSM